MSDEAIELPLKYKGEVVGKAWVKTDGSMLAELDMSLPTSKKVSALLNTPALKGLSLDMHFKEASDIGTAKDEALVKESRLKTINVKPSSNGSNHIYNAMTGVQKRVLHYYIGGIIDGNVRKDPKHDEVYAALSDEQRQVFDFFVKEAGAERHRKSK